MQKKTEQEVTRQKRKVRGDRSFFELYPGLTKLGLLLIIVGLIGGSIVNKAIADFCLWIVFLSIAGVGLWALVGILYEGVLIPLVETARSRRLSRVSGE